MQGQHAKICARLDFFKHRKANLKGASCKTPHNHVQIPRRNARNTPPRGVSILISSKMRTFALAMNKDSSIHDRLNRLRLPRPLRWLVRFRKRKGYGIHSPFAFAFVTQVIYERGRYYAYDSLDNLSHQGSALRRADLRLLFRIANYSEAQTVVLAHAPELLHRYLQAALPHAHFLSPEEAASARRARLLVYMEEWEQLAPAALFALCEENAIVVISRPHHAAKSRTAWIRLRNCEEVRVTMDLHDFALLFLEKRLNKENYVINYY